MAYKTKTPSKAFPILKTTKFYKQYHEFKSDLGSFSNEVIRVYEDNIIEVVYPTNSYSFNSFIEESGHDVTWCTQSPSTWESYNSRQYVMILRDKSGVEGIIKNHKVWKG